MKISNRKITKSNLYFIVEEAQANQGSVSVALEMIEKAKYAGADAIEFQLFITDDFYIKTHRAYERYKANEFSLEEIQNLIDYAKSFEIDFIATPLSHNLVDDLKRMGCDGFNINASDINNIAMIEKVAQTGLPFFISVPLASEKEIDWVISQLNQLGTDNYTFLHGQHTMASGEEGVQPQHTNLGYINELKNRYDKPIGYIDHSPFYWMPSSAVAAGANIITKHLILDRSKKGPDWMVALEPDEMKLAVQYAKEMAKSIYQTKKTLAPGEQIDIAIMRRSIVSNRDIKKGEIAKIEDFVFKRPGVGIPPSEVYSIIGKEFVQDIDIDEVIKEDCLKQK